MNTDPRKIRLLMSLRRSGVTDAAVLGAIERVPRERFVPAAFQDQAWDDTALPIDHGQTISQPLIVALMTASLYLNDRCKVLEIGTGSGYQTAVLAQLARRVYSIETIKPLQDGAARMLEALRIHNITLRHGDGGLGWPEQAPFDRIIVTAASDGDVPQALIDQLGRRRILVCPVKRALDDHILVRITRENGSLNRQDLFPVRFVPLVRSTGGRRMEA